jgi:hypothetical protein
VAERRYRLSEARALVPEVAALLEELRSARSVLVDEDVATRLAAHAPGNGGGADSTRMAEAALSFSRGLGRLKDLGVILRDLDAGIMDFIGTRAGEDVCLCWRDGEDTIDFWHEVDAGFAGRQPVDDEVE